MNSRHQSSFLRALRPDWPHAVPLLAAPDAREQLGRPTLGTALVAAAQRTHSYSLHPIVDSGASGTCAMTTLFTTLVRARTVKFGNGAVSRAIGQGRCSYCTAIMACHAAQCALRPLACN
jgi:hypothetical protein